MFTLILLLLAETARTGKHAFFSPLSINDFAAALDFQILEPNDIVYCTFTMLDGGVDKNEILCMMSTAKG